MNLEQLHAYVGLGWKIFPIAPNKKTPLTEHGFKNASDNPEQIALWYEKFPGCNWAVSCGRDSGIVVVDVDVSGGKKGAEALEVLIEKYGPIPKGPVVRTASGGFHIYFKYDESKDIRKGKLHEHIDFQANGSYTLLPPSRIDDSEYVWNKGRSPFDLALSELPDWMLELSRQTRTLTTTRDKGGKIPLGQRHNYLCSIGGSLRRRGVEYDTILAALISEFTNSCEQIPGEEVPVRDLERLADRLCRYAAEDVVFGDEDNVNARLKAIESERIVIAYVAQGDYFKGRDGLAAMFNELDEAFFLEPDYRQYFRHLRKIWSSGATPDYTNLKIELAKQEYPEAPLDTLMQEVSISNEGDLAYHIKNITESFKARSIARLYAEATSAALQGSASPSDIITYVSEKTISIVNQTKDENVYNTEARAGMVEEMFEKARLGIFDLNEPTGFASLDDAIIGFPRGELTFIGGRPGHFKTALQLQFNRQMNYKWKSDGVEGCSVFFSAEMSAAQLAMRDVCAIGRINNIELRKGVVEEDRVMNALREYRRVINTHVDQTASPTGDYIINKTLAINAQEPVRAVFFDFIGLSGESAREERHRLRNAAQKLKYLAKILNIPVIVSAQLNRNIEARNPPYPHESDLGESDSLTQLANQIIFTVYPYKFFQNGIIWDPSNPGLRPSRNELVFFLSKNRDGSPQKINMRVYPEYGLIIDPRDHMDETEIGSAQLFTA